MIRDSPNNCGLLCARLPGIWGFKYLIQFFKGATLCLHKEEIDEYKLEKVEEYEEYVEPILDLVKSAMRNIPEPLITAYILQCQRSCKGVDKTSASTD
jgi:hypothetical protein